MRMSQFDAKKLQICMEVLFQGGAALHHILLDSLMMVSGCFSAQQIFCISRLPAYKKRAGLTDEKGTLEKISHFCVCYNFAKLVKE